MIRELSLEAPGVEPLRFDPANGWLVESLDLGSPQIREVVSPRPGADGDVDTSSLIGARDVVLTVDMWSVSEPLWRMRDRLQAFQHPALRPTMRLRRAPDAPEQILSLRAVAAPRIIDPVDDDRVVATWRAPRGVLQSAERQRAVVFPGLPGGEAGVEFDVEFDIEFPPQAPPGAGQVVNLGTAAAAPVLSVFGPCGAAAGPDDRIVVSNATTGGELVFEELEILSGEYLEIDVERRTILLNGDPSQSRYDRLRVAESRWWDLAPGANVLLFRPDTSSGSAQMVVEWRHTSL